MSSYYEDKLDSLADLFGAASASLARGGLSVGGHLYPIVDDVIIALDPARRPPLLRQRLRDGDGEAPSHAASFSPATQYSFGAEWDAFADVLPEHEEEFRQYFDLVDLEALGEARVADLGCGSGRWSCFLAPRAHELVLVDFSEAIFVARRNLRGCSTAIFVMADVTRLPFRADFADLVVCLGVLHHLPVDALSVVRRLADHAPRALVYLYYALDNRAAHYRLLLRLVTAIRALTSRLRSPRARGALSWLGTAAVYMPLIAAGSLLNRLGLGGLVPLHDSYGGKSFRRVRQDVYDRFFTGIEQRFTRRQILELKDTFQDVRVSAGLPYWHFLCVRAGTPVVGTTQPARSLAEVGESSPGSSRR
jgi:SAM-dependent methyltransferase